METYRLLPFLLLDPQEMLKITAAMHQQVSVKETETKSSCFVSSGSKCSGCEKTKH